MSERPLSPALDIGPGYVATPVPTADRPGPWPGVVVVHDLFGLGDDIREQADWLAAAGYLVLVKDRRTVDMLETDLVLASQMRSLAHVYRVLAHDLRAPLNSMQLAVDLLDDAGADPDPSRA